MDDGPIRTVIKTVSLKTPLIKINSIPVENKDDDETTIGESTPLALVPPSSSKASSVTFVEENPHDAYANPDPIVHTHGWKPETMQSPVLLALALASLLIAALLELLAQKSAADGALSIVATAEDIPPLVSFGYLYLPTIVAVLYSLAWNWVDLDVKRMQPWLQLSREKGALGKDSLFLDYPVDFVAFVPFKAAKKRHWAVFYSGTIVVLVFWLLTPMQGAVFGTAPVMVSHKTNMSHPMALVEASQQAQLLDPAVLNAGYAITWRSQEYPAFTAPDYALLPFSPCTASHLPAPAANWTSRTVRYWTELACRPAIVERHPALSWGPVVADFLDGRGCNASNIMVHPGLRGIPRYMMLYVGYQDSAWAEVTLDTSPGCRGRPGAWNEFLATWSEWDNSTTPRTSEVRGAFCETLYWRQPVTAIVDAAPERLPDDDSVFNASAFQFLLGAGVSSVEGAPREYPFTTLLEQFARLVDAELPFPPSPMLGFAIGLSRAGNVSTARFADLDVVRAAFGAAHRMLFSVAFQHLLVNSTGMPGVAWGQAHVARYGVVVSRAFSALVEGVLGLVAVMTLLLLWTCRRAPSMLSEDMSSLSSLVALVRQSGGGGGGDDGTELQDVFAGTGHMGEDELRCRLGGYRFQLRCGCHDGSSSLSSGMPTMRVTGRPDYEEQQTEESGRLKDEFRPAGYLAPIKPVVLRTWTGVVFWVVIATATGVLVCLKQKDSELGGLPLPSMNPEVNTMLTSYLPTVFSTLVEPVWVLLNRYYCILQPFYDLVSPRQRKSTEPAMQSRYTALPPQLVLWRAIRARHLLLAAVCMTALLGNVLAVGLGALFKELPKRITLPRTFAVLRQPVLVDLQMGGGNSAVRGSSLYDDPYYVVMANFSYGTPLPAWTTSGFSFLPLGGICASGSSSSSDSSLFSGETVGFGVDANCRAVGTYTSDGLPPEVPVSFPNADPAAVATALCPATYRLQSPLLNTTGHEMPRELLALEIVETAGSGYGHTVCDETLLVGSARAALRNRTGEMHTSLVACSPTLRTARFRISFDRAGYVFDSVPVGDFGSVWSYQNRPLANTQPLLSSLHGMLRSGAKLRWHNDTVSHDWFNYLLKVYSPGTYAVTDPAAPLPDPAVMAPSVAAVYRTIFAAVLSLNPDMFLAGAPPGTVATGTEARQEQRVFISTAAFAVSGVVLGVYVAMAVAYYALAVKIFLPRMPSSVGSQLSYIAPSSMATAADVRKGMRVLFGHYVGHNGRAQIGIDYADRIVPLDIKRLNDGDTRPRKWSNIRFRRPPSRAETWL
ncbi:hypothetical protein LEL_07474 [Akanthomyces lecanii RCEF 1005]|uniref:Uncharacterized protein n=1 Tax=Akanthomyces lecanii RCEF 1005 TaxID=1081108 RepID=A0A168FQA5_CORDF|nr:hypothetical protein LEL_07474 [Akanthomyces lecanii RCEF 1005]